jgi:hypothetical protein
MAAAKVSHGGKIQGNRRRLRLAGAIMEVFPLNKGHPQFDDAQQGSGPRNPRENRWPPDSETNAGYSHAELESLRVQ